MVNQAEEEVESGFESSFSSQYVDKDGEDEENEAEDVPSEANKSIHLHAKFVNYDPQPSHSSKHSVAEDFIKHSVASSLKDNTLNH